MHELAGWNSFCLIVGSAAGALIGLQFVVMTLIAGRPGMAKADAGAAFATPTIVHFSVVLFLAALLRAPWTTILLPAIIWGVVGLGGLAYTIIVIMRMRKQDTYRPQFEDWLFHIMFPLAAYTSLVVSVFVALLDMGVALFIVAGGTLLLLFTGIHNSWDAVAYHVFVRRHEADMVQRPEKDSDNNDQV